MKNLKRISLIVFALAMASVAVQLEPFSGPSKNIAAAASATPAIKPLNRRFLLTQSTAVYKQPDHTSEVLTHVRRKTHVNVVGITGNWLEVRTGAGIIGFIPTDAAE